MHSLRSVIVAGLHNVDMPMTLSLATNPFIQHITRSQTMVQSDTVVLVPIATSILPQMES